MRPAGTFYRRQNVREASRRVTEFWFMYTYVAKKLAKTLAVCCCGLLSLASARLSAQTQPTSWIQPTNGVALVGEDYVFVAFTMAAPPVSYQWIFNGQPLPGQTYNTLVLNNLIAAQSGLYSVAVTDVNNHTTISSSASLQVVTNIFRHLNTGRIQQVGMQAAVPIVMRVNGRENSVSFSMSYNTNHYSNPVFLPADTNATVSVNSQPGVVGVAETLPAGRMFPAGRPWLGLLRFDLASTNSTLLGGLHFTNSPVPVAAANTNGKVLSLSTAIQPQYVLATPRPTLDYQSGLFIQRMFVSNPGSEVMSNINLFALDLGVDSSGHSITVYNATARLTSPPLGDPVITVSDTCCGYWLYDPVCDFSSYLDCGGYGTTFDVTGVTNLSLPCGQMPSLLPGQTIVYTSEFYVSDHRTIPDPRYSIFAGGAALRVPPGTGSVLAVTRYIYDPGNQRFILQFPTRTGYYYYVQYADSPAALSTNALTAYPPVPGTGAEVQWIDDGPPKTVTPPGAGSRFYSIREL